MAAAGRYRRKVCRGGICAWRKSFGESFRSSRFRVYIKALGIVAFRIYLVFPKISHIATESPAGDPDAAALTAARKELTEALEALAARKERLEALDASARRIRDEFQAAADRVKRLSPRLVGRHEAARRGPLRRPL